MFLRSQSRLAPYLMIPIALLFTGCQTGKAPATPSTVDVRKELRIELADGDSLDWEDFIERIAETDGRLSG